jgi:hypothetical protein
MNQYAELIGSTPLIKSVEVTATTGDLDYDGTALEITTPDGDELFHVVIDQHGETQVLFFRSEGNYRLPLEVLERIVESAKTQVKSSG